MSIHKVENLSGISWRVIWRDAQSNRFSRNFPKLKGEGMAESFEARIKDLKARDELHLLFGGLGGKTTLGDYAKRYVERMENLGQIKRSTLNNYIWVWDAYCLSEDFGIAHRTLRELEVNRSLLRDFRDELVKAGVAYHSRKRTFVMLSAMMREAVEDDYIKVNPVRGILIKMTNGEQLKASQSKKNRHALSPLEVEQLRKQLNSRVSKQRPGVLALRDAVLVGLIANEGLRPGEALYLRWGHLGKRLAIEGSVSLGEENIGGKTNSERNPKIQNATREDLFAFRKACGNPDDGQLIFPSPENGYWSDDAYRYWRRASFKYAIRELGKKDKKWLKFASARPYDLRMSAASLRIRAGEPATDIAEHMGHSVETLYRHYAGVIQGMEDEKPVPVPKAIAAARKKVWGAETGVQSLPPLHSDPPAAKAKPKQPRRPHAEKPGSLKRVSQPAT